MFPSTKHIKTPKIHTHHTCLQWSASILCNDLQKLPMRMHTILKKWDLQRYRIILTVEPKSITKGKNYVTRNKVLRILQERNRSEHFQQNKSRIIFEMWINHKSSGWVCILAALHHHVSKHGWGLNDMHSFTSSHCMILVVKQQVSSTCSA